MPMMRRCPQPRQWDSALPCVHPAICPFGQCIPQRCVANLTLIPHYRVVIPRAAGDLVFSFGMPGNRPELSSLEIRILKACESDSPFSCSLRFLYAVLFAPMTSLS